MTMRHSEITPKALYVSRRQWIASLLAAPALAGEKLQFTRSPLSTTEKQTTYNDVTTYNNFYEFGAQKNEPAVNAKNFRTRPWTVEIGGAVVKPKTLSIEEVMKVAPLEERVYRHRCVEGWSMVVPWIGFPLSALLKQVEPLGKAKFVAFQSLYDSKQMKGGTFSGIPFPYKEGLRIDEAMNPLTLMTVGLYGEVLPNQNGAPMRLVVPWKYGFKGLKSIVKIQFVEKQPETTWNLSAPQEYGFYSNVNPEVAHPRWSQEKERRIGEFFRIPTQMFNGYGPQVASMYAGMDLKKNY